MPGLANGAANGNTGLSALNPQAAPAYTPFSGGTMSRSMRLAIEASSAGSRSAALIATTWSLNTGLAALSTTPERNAVPLVHSI